ncbi:hypothetical protein ACFSL4_22490 [Streptomyces caeni]|uniref:Uncharacterized protein n=1 Tax=Streptomyces caeni TaxID=2307231 RepID=A0ABW4IWL4_9ACTN
MHLCETTPGRVNGECASFHAKIADKKGNKSTISICNAFHGR